MLCKFSLSLYWRWRLFYTDIFFRGGGIYFQEFDGFSAKQYGMFFLSILIIFVGVGVLGDRLKRSHV
jgi:hypothetical protein